jgi:localization factor PodJL
MVGRASANKSLAQRVRSLFSRAGVILVIAGFVGVGSGLVALSKWTNADRRLEQAQADAGEAKPQGDAAATADSATSARGAPERSSESATSASGQNATFALTRQPQFLLQDDPRAGATVTAKDKPIAQVDSVAASDRVGAASGDGDITGTTSSSSIPDLTAPTTSTATKPVADERLPASVIGTVLQAALAVGDPAAAYEMGSRYAEGRGLAADPRAAALWFDRAVKAGSVPAMFRFAAWYEKGEGGARNLQEARRLYLAAAGQGHAKAMHNLAVLYADGVDGKPDYVTAAQWFRKAAEYAVADSQYNLGVLYARGIGVERNFAESYKWFALAAAQGDREAAKQSDEIAAKLDANALTAARQAVQSFVPKTQPAAATVVSTPPGGWDQPVANTGSLKPKTGNRSPQLQPKTTL